MDRRDFLALSTAAVASPLSIQDTEARAATRQFIELRRYHLLPGARQKAFTEFVGNVAIPAMNRAGITTVGAFTVMYGENAPTLLLVLPHPSLDSVALLRERLEGDETYLRGGAGILDTPISEPAFVRAESTLLRAFESMPVLERPSTPAPPRLFELRTYQSHSDRAALNKLRMFDAGEIPIFRRAGLTPVFFGETVVGAGMPSLTYMVTFPDMAAHDKGWASFLSDPEWKALLADPQYRDNISSITDIILRPTAYSQL